MIDFAEIDKKVTLLPESAFFLVFCSEAVFLLLEKEQARDRKTIFDARECLSRAISYILKMKRPAGPTHQFFQVYEELASRIMNSETIDPEFLSYFLAEAHDLAEMIEI